MVATENGGPVDIHRALNNGLLIDPHDHKAIADALSKLVADKAQWLECRKNGFRNIHLFSWPEHCRTYLTRVAACRMRHPQWQTDTPTDEIAVEESLGDSLTDFQETSLRLSIDGEKGSLNGSTDYDLEEVDEVTEGGPELQDQVKCILNKIKKHSPNQGIDSTKKQDEILGHTVSKYPLLRRRRRLFVIALD
ncbi:putative sucrose-phosphate synthase 2 [Iris pallida]|nr:putative sucrose-phosphate synthase 2 [Iris pallida]